MRQIWKLSWVISVVLAAAINGYALEIRELAGTWAPEDYVDKVKRTLAGVSQGAESVQFVPAGRGDTWQLDWTNYRESIHFPILGLKKTSTAGTYQLILKGATLDLRVARNASGEVQNLVFNKNTAHKPFISLKKSYIHLSASLEDQVRSWVLVGTYKDPRGQDYFFSSFGEARWPEGYFRYAVSLKPQNSNCGDTVYETDERGNAVPQGKRYMYQWQSGQLLIFAAPGTETCSQQPVTTLTPVQLKPVL